MSICEWATGTNYDWHVVEGLEILFLFEKLSQIQAQALCSRMGDGAGLYKHDNLEELTAIADHAKHIGVNLFWTGNPLKYWDGSGLKFADSTGNFQAICERS